MIQEFSIGLLFGAIGWTLLEYIIHYWLGHLPKGKVLISSEHLKHHANILYFTPALLKLRGAVPVLGILFAAAWFLVGSAFAVGFVLSVSIGWMTYEYLHQSIHVRGPTTAYGRWAAKYHLYHHFMRPNRNHGVTNPLWDILLRTHDKVTTVKIRKRDISDIPWLKAAFDNPSEAPAFIADYELRA